MSDEARDRAEDVFEDWVSRCREGRGEPREELIEAYPDLADELGARLRDLDAVLDPWRRSPHPSGIPGWTASGARSLGEAGRLLVQGGRLGRYQLQREIGEGGMGVVWLARDPWMKELVALKFLPHEFVRDRASMRQLRDEAKITRELTHEGVVRLHQFEADSGLAFLVEEYLAGGNLADALDGRKLTAAEARWLLVQIAPPLDYAHAKGITHRDIKPGNLLLTTPLLGPLGSGAERVKIADFGLAFVASSVMSLRSNYNPSGTLPYMSPEVLLGRKPTPAADIYSVGIAVYELVKGELPFRTGDIPTQIRERVPPPLHSGDRALDAAIARALAKDPAERPHSVAELASLAFVERKGAAPAPERVAEPVATYAAAPPPAPAPVPAVAAPSRAALPVPAPHAPHASRARRRRKSASRGMGGKLALFGISAAVLGILLKLGLGGGPPADASAGAEASGPVEIQLDDLDLRGGKLYLREGRLALRGRVANARGEAVHARFSGDVRSTPVPFVGALSPDGTRSFELVRTINASGELSLRADGLTRSHVLDVVLDREAPTIEDLAPEGPVYEDQIDVRVLVRDENLALVLLDGKPMRAAGGGVFEAGPFPPPVGRVPRSFRVRAVDHAERATELGIERSVVPRTVVKPERDHGSGVPRWTPFELKLRFDPPVAEFRVDGHPVALSEGGAGGSVRLQPPDRDGDWLLTGTGVDRGGRPVRLEVSYSVFDWLRIPEGYEAVDKTMGARGHASKIRHRSLPGLELRLIEPGRFEMGGGESGKEYESGQRGVVIATPFYISERLVTIQQFRAWGTRGYPGATWQTWGGLYRRGPGVEEWQRSEHARYNDPIPLGFGFRPTSDYPVTQVSFWDAVEFCRAHGFRLPTEAEWEYAARAGDDGWWQRTREDGEPRFNLADEQLEGLIPKEDYPIWLGDLSDDEFPFLSPVNAFAPNPWGLYDVLGNVSEWTLDVFDPWLLSDGGGTDPLTGSFRRDGATHAEARAVRGANWFTLPKDAHPWRRYFEPEDSATDFIGFRVVLDAEGRHELPQRRSEPSDEWAQFQLACFEENGHARATWRSYRDRSGLLDFEPDDKPGSVLRPDPDASAADSQAPGRRDPPPSGRKSGVRTLDWAETLQDEPDAKVVAPEFRDLIRRTKLPWRVRDRVSGIEMLLVPPGKYTRGASSDDPKSRGDEMPTHDVTIRSPFYLGRYEVQKKEWSHVMDGEPLDLDLRDFPKPATYRMALEFLEEAPGLRLPTEAEWEYACRAGVQAMHYGDLSKIGWVPSNCDGGRHRVGQLQANGLGLHDMLGNVFEYCSDYYSGDEYTRCERGVVDPSGPSSGDSFVMRGGAANPNFDDSAFCTASRRGSCRLDEKVYATRGFRVARTP